MSDELKPCPFCGGEAEIRTTPVKYQVTRDYFCCKNNCCFMFTGSIETWNRRQEAKPLTPDELWKIIGPFCQYTHTAKDAEELCLKIHAALPPDQSARIAELEKNVSTLVKALDTQHKQCVDAVSRLHPYNEKPAPHLARKDDCYVCALIDRIKAGQPSPIESMSARAPSRDDIDGALTGAEKEWLGFGPHGSLRECQIKWIMALWGKV